MRIGIYGGSFDPVHYGHLLLAERCREQAELDRVMFLPAATPPHKRDRPLSAPEHRIAMLELAIGGGAAFEVSRHEILRGGVSYTVDTLAHFARQEPQAALFLLVGADMLNDLPHWHEAPRVCELALPLVVRRGGMDPPDYDCLRTVASPERIAEIRAREVDMPALALSSAELRRRVGRGQSIRYCTPRAVEEYIRAQRLYAG